MLRVVSLAVLALVMLCIAGIALATAFMRGSRA